MDELLCSRVLPCSPVVVKPGRGMYRLLWNEDAINQMAVPPFPSPPSLASSNEVPHGAWISASHFTRFQTTAASWALCGDCARARSHHNAAIALNLSDKPQAPESLLLSRNLPESSLLKDQASVGLGDSVAPPPREPALKSLSDGESVSKCASHPKPCRGTSRLPIGPTDRAISPSCISPDFEYCSRDPATCPIVPGQETVIEISKGRSGLGLSIVGGRDTQLVSPTFAPPQPPPPHPLRVKAAERYVYNSLTQRESRRGRSLTAGHSESASLLCSSKEQRRGDESSGGAVIAPGSRGRARPGSLRERGSHRGAPSRCALCCLPGPHKAGKEQ
ncbi:hypothetical protein JZ751_024708, partial [Albula glossodonta]